MLILLSPSKTQDITKQTAQEALSHSFATPICIEDSLSLLTELKLLPKETLAKLMAISLKLAELNYQRYQQFSTPITLQNSKPAIFTFKGDVYQNIEADGYSQQELDYANSHLRILSGFYGYLKPLDLIQPYRLEMKTKLKNSRGANLYEFWKAKLTALVNKEPTGPLINLASDEYFSAVDSKKVIHKIITPIFKDYHKGQYKIIGIHAKRARGMMVNFMIKKQINDANMLKEFAEAGYKFDLSQSGEQDWVFLRK